MENDKPFKVIEVIDSRTKQLCKVACMSCIRGHRTTQCGIPVCRNKVFWTVKRPGRPSNGCTCRYNKTGGCKCTSTKPSCPHKAKKGEKRSGECRCDEQGRYCCSLEPLHWTALMSLQNPSVDFYPTREALETGNATSRPTTAPATPSLSVSSPRPFRSLLGTPVAESATQPLSGFSSPQHTIYSPQTATITPRFGMMGLGAPQGSADIITPDVLSWQGQAPEAPQQYHPLQHEQQAEPSFCCQGSNALQSEPYQYVPPPAHTSDLPIPVFGAFDNVAPMMTMPEQHVPAATSFDFNKLSHDYLAYQFPSAICQTCGLSGCTCRNCPPVMQNFSTGSWAQCCGRKHARTGTYVPANVPAAFELPPKQPSIQPTEDLELEMRNDKGFDAFELGTAAPELEPPSGDFDFSTFDVDADFALPTDSSNLDLSEFLMSELERPPEGGCCCGDP